MGNSSLLCLYNLILFTGYRMRPRGPILNQLLLARSLLLFSIGILQAVAVFERICVLDDAEFKHLFFFFLI